MFSMDQARKVEDMNVLGALISAATRADSATVGNIKSVLDNYRESAGYSAWSNDNKNKAKKKVRDDQDLLSRVANLGKTK